MPVLVSSCLDGGAGSGSLRDAIANAATGTTIDLSTSGCSSITLTTGEISFSLADLTITGPGDDSLTISGNHNGRVFDHTGSGTLTLNHLTLADGQVSSGNAYGGCVYSKGSVTLSHATVTGCSVQAAGNFSAANGGGVGAMLTVTLSDSTISGNSATASGYFASVQGAGIWALGGAVGGNGSAAGFSSVSSTLSGNVASATGDNSNSQGGGVWSRHDVVIDSSTIDANQAAIGGGIFTQFINGPYTLKIVNSTISGNTTSLAGGIYAGGKTTEIYNSTVAFNSAAATSAGLVTPSPVSLILQSSIFANNTLSGLGDTDLHVEGTVQGANNLIVAANQSPGGSLKADPQLTPLGKHGGPTRTHALNVLSPAIDAGSNVSTPTPPYDQRGVGFDRSIGVTDIGAYERQTSDDEIFYGGFQ